MTLLEIKTAIATYFRKTVAELTLNGQDIALIALNQVRRQAELTHDFEFSRKLVTVSVNGVTGGSLSSAVIYGTATTVKVKSVIEAGLFDDDTNLRPVEWTTVSESLERQREDNSHFAPRYPTDGWARTGPAGLNRFDFTGTTIYRWPKDDQNNFTLGLEVYTFQDDWTGVDALTATGNPVPAGADGAYNPVLTTFNGRPLYLHEDTGTNTAYFAYWDDTADQWQIGAAVGDSVTDFWAQAGDFDTPLAGAYTANGTYINTLTLTVAPVEDVWTIHASQYLLWAAIVHINFRFKEFAFRQEGNLPPPTQLAEAGLAAFVEWDSYTYEQNRRHGR